MGASKSKAIGETNRPNITGVVRPPQLPNPVDKNMVIFKSSTHYKNIISSSGVYSSLYRDCLIIKQTSRNVTVLTEKELYNEFNKMLLHTSSTTGRTVEDFYNDLSKETKESLRVVKNFLLDYLTKIITQIVNEGIYKNTNLDLSMHSRLINANIREYIRSSLEAYYDSPTPNPPNPLQINWNNATVLKVIDFYIKNHMGTKSLSNIFKLYTGDISVFRNIRILKKGGYRSERIYIYNILYRLTLNELKKIDKNINPEVPILISLQIFFDNYADKPTNETGFFNNLSSYIEPLKTQMLMYILETIYVKTSTSTSTMPLVSEKVQDMINNSKELYEYDEEDEEPCGVKDVNKMYSIHIFLMMLLLLLLLVLILMKSKNKLKI